MADKTKKVEWKEGDTPLTQEQLLKLQVLFLKHENVKSKIQTLEQRRAAIAMEDNVIVNTLPQMKKQQEEAAAVFQKAFADVKQEYGLSDDLEINADTGVLTKRQQPQQPAQ